jgi:hypothetical protein
LDRPSVISTIAATRSEPTRSTDSRRARLRSVPRAAPGFVAGSKRGGAAARPSAERGTEAAGTTRSENRKTSTGLFLAIAAITPDRARAAPTSSMRGFVASRPAAVKDARSIASR